MIKNEELEQSIKRNDEIIIQNLEEIKNLLATKNDNEEQQEQSRKNIHQQLRDPIKEIKLTTIVGPQADKMINSLKRGEAFTFRDNSVEGVPILEVYVEVDTGFWWD